MSITIWIWRLYLNLEMLSEGVGMSRKTQTLVKALQQVHATPLQVRMAACILAVNGLNEALEYVRNRMLPSPEAAFEEYLSSQAEADNEA